ncbi:MAG: NAD(P)-dependent oxidoreductase [Gemmatimonadetes bacterium]|nr:NAD(P)-dependent oxidoreductase [Gemmatimonadota bacterium]
MTTLAFLGLGAMGAPMAANLVAAGFRVRAWNRSAHRTESLAGAIPCRTPREAATGAEFVLTMLADDAAVEAVTFGPDGLLAALGGEALHLGMSTLSVAAVRRLVAAHADHGRVYLAAPVFGRPEAAKARQLWVVPGGDAIALSRAAPVFEALGQGTFPFPTAEQAALAKLAGNFLLGATVEALGEALVLAEKGGLDPEQFLALMTGTLFGTPVHRNYGARIARTEFLPAGFALALARKDFRLITAAAGETGTAMPLAELVLERLNQCVQLGRAGYDFAGLTSVIREESGLPERR